MAIKIVIQAGHLNTKNNVDPALRSSTGAPGEVEFTQDVAIRVTHELIKRGFEVINTDANFNSDIRRVTDYDLFLAIHYESDTHKTNGYFVAAPDPSVDEVNPTSVKIRDIISDEYSKIGIPSHPEWQNPNTRFYYMWSALSAKTPCVLIECGVGWRTPKDSDILNSDKRSTIVIPAIVKGVCRAFNVLYDQSIPVDPKDQKILELTKQIVDLQVKINTAKAALN